MCRMGQRQSATDRLVKYCLQVQSRETLARVNDLIFREFANVNGRTTSRSVHPRLCTPLIAAIQASNQPLVDKLLKCGASVTVTDGRGMTPLMWAVQYSRWDIVDQLMGATNHGALSLHMHDEFQRTIFDFCLDFPRLYRIIEQTAEWQRIKRDCPELLWIFDFDERVKHTYAIELNRRYAVKDHRTFMITMDLMIENGVFTRSDEKFIFEVFFYFTKRKA
jgi:hypothetical protein